MNGERHCKVVTSPSNPSMTAIVVFSASGKQEYRFRLSPEATADLTAQLVARTNGAA